MPLGLLLTRIAALALTPLLLAPARARAETLPLTAYTHTYCGDHYPDQDRFEVGYMKGHDLSVGHQKMERPLDRPGQIRITRVEIPPSAPYKEPSPLCKTRFFNSEIENELRNSDWFSLENPTGLALGTQVNEIHVVCSSDASKIPKAIVLTYKKDGIKIDLPCNLKIETLRKEKNHLLHFMRLFLANHKGHNQKQLGQERLRTLKTAHELECKSLDQPLCKKIAEFLSRKIDEFPYESLQFCDGGTEILVDTRLRAVGESREIIRPRSPPISLSQILGGLDAQEDWSERKEMDLEKLIPTCYASPPDYDACLSEAGPVLEKLKNRGLYLDRRTGWNSCEHDEERNSMCNVSPSYRDIGTYMAKTLNRALVYETILLEDAMVTMEASNPEFLDHVQSIGEADSARWNAACGSAFLEPQYIAGGDIYPRQLVLNSPEGGCEYADPRCLAISAAFKKFEQGKIRALPTSKCFKVSCRPNAAPGTDPLIFEEAPPGMCFL